ncbi:MAG: hypothetical protein EB121_01530 [Alphaproteobacteria bacterium]|nr:hypothetical protein [Alphaproteobacteria bacterium]
MDLAGHPLFDGSKEGLTQLLLNAINQFSFDEVKQFGFQKTAQLITTLPIFPSTEIGEIVDFSGGKTPVEVLARRLPNGLYRFPPATSYALLGRVFNDNGTYRYLSELGGEPKIFYDINYGVCFAEQIAYWLTANPPVGFFGLDPVTKVMGQLLERFDKTGSSGSAWQAMGVQVLLRDAATKFIQRSGLNDINALGDPEIDADGQEQPFFIEGYAQGEGFTYAYLFYENGTWVFRTIGQATGFKAFLQDFGPLLQIAALGLAVYGIGAALASISSSGATFLNVAQLTASVDNLPGVDLGVVGDVASGVSGGIKLAEGIGANMFNFEDLDLGDIAVVDPGSFEIDLSLADIGANVIDFDLSTFEDFGLEATDLLPDAFGNIFTVTGDAVSLDPETYVKTIYIDEGGNYRDFSNEVVMSQAEADAAFNERGLDEDVSNALAQKVRGLSGSTFVATPGSANRPDGTPAPAAQGERPFFEVLSQEVLGWFKTITSYSLAKEQLEKTGRYTPPYATNPNGTAYSQVPGVPVRRADGSVVTNNGNGTQTIQYPSGQVQTVPVSVNPAQINQGVYTPGSFGGSLIPGVQNSTLLIAGAGLVAVALLARRK